MASRAVGALLGITAAALLAASLATSAWWSGHPVVDGHSIGAKDAYVGLWSATGCNTGGIGNCERVHVGETFATAALGELAIAGVATLLVLLLGISIVRDSERKKLVAKLAIAAIVLAAIGGGLLILLGPQIKGSSTVEVPIGWGMMVFWGGIAAGSLASVATLAARLEPLRLKTAPPPMMPHELMHQGLAPAPTPFGEMRINSEALSYAPTPLVTGPQLRTLYEHDGAAPEPARPPLPTRAPTPMPRAQISSLAGIPTPPGMAAAPEQRTLSSLPPPPAQLARAESEPIAPPPPSPPLPPRMPIARNTPPPPHRNKPASAAPPPMPRASAPAIPTEKRSKPTIAHAIPPPPNLDSQPPPRKLAPGTGRLSTEQDDRLETGMRETEAITSVEIDSEAKARANASERAETPLADPANDVGDRTDVGVELAPRAETSTAETPTVLPPEPQAEPQVQPQPQPQVQPQPQPHVPLSTAPASLPPPKTAQVATSGPTPACPQCESPMAWVEEHLRFYCKQCRMYF
jgi:hypothetical protein